MKKSFFVGLAILFGLSLWGIAGARQPQYSFKMQSTWTAGVSCQEEVLAAMPLFIFMGYITEQAELMERLFRAFRYILAPLLALPFPPFVMVLIVMVLIFLLGWPFGLPALIHPPGPSIQTLSEL